jgi:hypothetical protein
MHTITTALEKCPGVGRFTVDPGGLYLLQYDMARHDYGSTPVMTDYVASHSLGLQIIECCEPIDYKTLK